MRVRGSTLRPMDVRPRFGPAMWTRVRAAMLAVIVGSGCGRGAAAPELDPAPPAKTKPDVERGDFTGRAFPLLLWAVHTVAQEYYDKTRFDPHAQLTSAGHALGMHTPEIFVDRRGEALHVAVGAATAEFDLTGVDSLPRAADRLEDILVFAQKVLQLDPEPLHELEYAAINGFFAPLDPHTILLTPEEHADLGIRTKGQFGGIGAEIRAERHRILVVRVLPGMPAEVAGLRGGDVILKIDGESTVNMSASEAQQLLRGPVGTPVTLQVQRTPSLLDVTIERGTIHIESVETAQLPNGIGYIGIRNFQEDTATRVRAAFSAFMEAGPLRGVVFDLRGNAGGLLMQATAVVDQMVARGELVVVHSALGREVDAAEPEVVLPTETAVVVLLDEASASAAEIVGGGVQALGRGVVVGRSSFGKGTVQMVRPAAPYGRELALKLTIAEYRVAGDGRIQGRGVVPDVELRPVELTRIPGIVRYFDVERFERQRERYRTARLPSGKHERVAVAGDEVAAIHYLNAPDPKVERAVEREEVPSQVLDPEIRIAARLADALAMQSDSRARRAVLDDAVATFVVEEEERVRTALRRADLDWSAPPAGAAAPRLDVRARLVQGDEIRAGDPFTLELEVRNLGDAPVHRVHAVTDCVHDELDGIEVLFGKVAPGATARRRLSLHVMPWHPSFTDVLDIAVHAGEPDAQPDATTQVMFQVEHVAAPSFSYDVWIVDDPALARVAPQRPPAEVLSGETPWTVQGNGDGMLGPGESVLVAFAAYNEGPGTAREARAVLRNSSGRQGLLEEGTYELGSLAPGRVARGAFGLTVAADADPRLPLELELAIGDAVLRTHARDKLRLRVLPDAPAPAREPTRVRIVGEEVPGLAGAHAGAGVALLLSDAPLEAIGRFGEFLGFDADHGRRVFVRDDPAVYEPLAGARPRPLALRSRQDVPDAVRWRPSVLPPTIDVAPVALATSAEHVVVEGVVSHPVGVHDVVVLVRPAGASVVERKVEYAAAPVGATSFSFRAEVPLEPGGNRITIVARDRAKVQGRAERWVFRGSEVPSGAAVDAGP